MKTLLFLLFFSNLIFAQIINIPDANFKARLLQADVDQGIAWATLPNTITNRVKIDTNNNGEIEVNEAMVIKVLYVNSSNISNLTGIEYFINLNSLWIHHNNLTSININTLTQLENILLTHNQITSLNVSNLSLLKQIDISYNKFTTINLSNNSNLVRLWCRDNPFLTSINLKNNSNQDFTTPNGTGVDCWYFLPNLTTICADSTEITALQQFLTTCYNSSSINITTDCLLDSAEFEKISLNIYPNPTADILNIESTNEIQYVEVYDAQLRLIKKISVFSRSYKLELSYLNAGCYFLKILEDDKSYTKKIIKK